MKLETFEIHFDNARGVFSSGEQVKGNVILKLARPMKMRSISIYFEGRSKSHWEVKHGRSKTDYRANEAYINRTVKLYGTGQTTEEHPSGYHTYPFVLTLAPTLPSSFEGRRGYVRYFCKATIDRPWKFDENTKRAFTVIHHLDLNLVSTASMPIVAEQDEVIEGCCCSSGSVSAKLSLNKSGFVPGEPVVYNIDVFNKSDSNVDRIELELKQVVTYTGFSDSLFSSGNPKYHTKLDTFTLLNNQCRIKQNMEEHINRAATIPALPPSRLDGCGIIDITYTIALKVNIGWTTLTIEREVTIGTVPLHQFPAVDVMNPLCPSAPPIDMEAPPPYSEPPPSYEESVFGRVEIRDENDDEHTSGPSAWAPAYPYYSWNQPPPAVPPPQYNQL